VKRGSDYAATCREISERLMELTNPATGRGAVKRVWSRDEVFPGAAADLLPDLIVTWDDSSRISAVTSPRFGTIEMPSPDPRTGTHSPRAFLAATGPGIRAGEHGNGRLVDVAPTVLGMLGIAAEGMEGRRLVH
jgi:predicted AlkP superfamily phosphohydrolase/phosphomutase